MHALVVVVWTGSGSALRDYWHMLPPPLVAAWSQGKLTGNMEAINYTFN